MREVASLLVTCTIIAADYRVPAWNAAHAAAIATIAVNEVRIIDGLDNSSVEATIVRTASPDTNRPQQSAEF
jgi:hypothetical protein